MCQTLRHGGHKEARNTPLPSKNSQLVEKRKNYTLLGLGEGFQEKETLGLNPEGQLG